MRKQLIYSLTCCLMLLMAFTSCEEDKHYSKLPTFSGFKFSPGVIHSGDSVYVIAVQQTQGDLLYKAQYTWTVNMSGTDPIKKDSVVIYDYDKSNPQFKFKVPEGVSGQLVVGFRARYHYSATAPEEIRNGTKVEGQGLVGTIKVENSALLEGSVSGSFQETIFP